MALTRPPAPSCSDMAAMGPQLEKIAKDLDALCQKYSTTAIGALLDLPTASGIKNVAQGITPNTLVSVSWQAQEFSNNQGVVFSGTGLTLPILSQARWYLCGVWLQVSAPVASNTTWKVVLNVTSKNPLTGVVTGKIISKAMTETLLGTGVGHLWFETYLPSSGGVFNVIVKQNSAGSLNVTSGRLWAMGLSKQR